MFQGKSSIFQERFSRIPMENHHEGSIAINFRAKFRRSIFQESIFIKNSIRYFRNYRPIFQEFKFDISGIEKTKKTFGYNDLKRFASIVTLH